MAAQARPDTFTARTLAPPTADGPRPQEDSAWRQFLREHWLICIVLLAATVVRVITMLAYPPAFWFPDSLPYVRAAVQPLPYTIRGRSGTPFLLLGDPGTRA